MLIFTAPDWQGSSPETITRKGPIDIVIEPISVTSSLNCLWMPVGLLILTNERILN